MADIFSFFRRLTQGVEPVTKTQEKTQTQQRTQDQQETQTISTQGTGNSCAAQSEETCTQVRELAYEKWEAAGCPEGDGQDFWFEAEQELGSQGQSQQQLSR